MASTDIEALRDRTQLEWQDSCITDSTSMNYKRQSIVDAWRPHIARGLQRQMIFPFMDSNHLFSARK